MCLSVRSETLAGNLPATCGRLYSWGMWECAGFVGGGGVSSESEIRSVENTLWEWLVIGHEVFLASWPGASANMALGLSENGF